MSAMKPKAPEGAHRTFSAREHGIQLTRFSPSPQRWPHIFWCCGENVKGDGEPRPSWLVMGRCSGTLPLQTLQGQRSFLAWTSTLPPQGAFCPEPLSAKRRSSHSTTSWPPAGSSIMMPGGPSPPYTPEAYLHFELEGSCLQTGGVPSTPKSLYPPGCALGGIPIPEDVPQEEEVGLDDPGTAWVQKLGALLGGSGVGGVGGEGGWGVGVGKG